MTKIPANYLRLINNFAQRELKARYKRSLLGWLWSLINPLSVVLVYTIVFGVVFPTTPPDTVSGNGEYFALYLFSGLVCWNLFTAVINGSMGWLSGVMELRKKIFFPTETAILGGAVATGTQTLLEAFVLAVCVVIVGNISVYFLFLPLILLLLMIGTVGVGFVISILNARYRDVGYLVGIVLNLGFYTVPIVYPLSLIEERTFKGVAAETILKVNPLFYYIDAAHDVAYIGRAPSLMSMVVMVGTAIIPFLLGLVFFRARSMEISEEL